MEIHFKADTDSQVASLMKCSSTFCIEEVLNDINTCVCINIWINPPATTRVLPWDSAVWFVSVSSDLCCQGL